MNTNLGKFFQISKKKIIVTIALFAFASLVFSLIYNLFSTFYTYWAAPLPIYSAEKVCPLYNIDGGIASECSEPQFSIVFLLANLAIWYIISSIIIQYRQNNA